MDKPKERVEMPIYLLDDSLVIKVFFEKTDKEFEDDICISIFESCPEEERVFVHDETNIYLTPKEARHLARALNKAARQSEADFKERQQAQGPPEEQA